MTPCDIASAGLQYTHANVTQSGATDGINEIIEIATFIKICPLRENLAYNKKTHRGVHKEVRPM